MKTELLILGILILNIFVSYNIDIGFYNLFKDFNNSLQHIYLKEFFIEINILGKSQWYFVGSILFFILCYLSKYSRIFDNSKKIILVFKKYSLFLFFSLVVTGLLTQLLKHIVGRPRPNYTSLDNSFGFNFFNFNSEFHSFPSGHTSTIFAVALVTSYFIPKLKYYFIFLASIISFSRIVVGAHFFTDVLGGIVIAYLGIKLTLMLLNRFFIEDLLEKNISHTNNKIFLSFVVFFSLILFLTVGPSLDIYLSGLFYFGNSQFLLQSYYDLTVFFRKVVLPLIIIYMLIIPIISIFLPIKKLYFNFEFKIRDILFIWFSSIINLVVLVNIILKNHWGRARPGEVLQLGGKENFTPWFQISDSCSTNCSFVSGDAAVGFSLIILFFLAKKEIYFWLSVFCGGILGTIRIMEGGHFFSDIVMSGLILYFACYLQTKYYLKKYD